MTAPGSFCRTPGAYLKNTCWLKVLKKILHYLQEQWKADFDARTYSLAAVFLLLAFAFNYATDFEDSVLDQFYGTSKGALYKSLFFLVAWYSVAIPALLFKKQQHVLKTGEFWVKSLLLNVLAGTVSVSDWHLQLLHWFNGHPFYFATKVLIEFKRLVFYTPVLLGLWLFYDRQADSVYGFTRRSFDYRPYLAMLLVAAPFIIAASFNAGFLKTYPRFQPWRIAEANLATAPLSTWQMTSIFELMYMLDFVFVEWLFRGAMVVGMAKLMGRGAVLPMASAYAFFHFGKPAGEALSSVFGGYLLGAIAFQTRNISGGILIHAGVALLMETAAWLQHVR